MIRFFVIGAILSSSMICTSSALADSEEILDEEGRLERTVDADGAIQDYEYGSDGEETRATAPAPAVEAPTPSAESLEGGSLP